LERVVRDSEPPVPEDREQRERNRLLAEEQKQKKDATKRKHGEIIRARESPLEPDSDDGDFDIFSDEKEEQGFRGVVPPQGAPTGGPQGSSVLSEERAGVWSLGPCEMMVLWGVATSVPRPERPGGA
jgi:hypothetical protein